MPYVTSFCTLDYDEVTYVEPQLTMIDGISVYTENPTDQVSMEKEVPDMQKELILNWYNMYGTEGTATPYVQEDEEQLLDTYILRSDAKCAHIFIPVDQWAEVNLGSREIDWRFWSPSHNLHQQWDYTDDGKYIGTKLYFLDYDYISFRVVATGK